MSHLGELFIRRVVDMHVDQFNQEFAPLYAEFGYAGSVSLPTPLNSSTLLAGIMTQPDETVAIAGEHTEVNHYFVRLYWHSLQVGEFDCLPEQYDQEIMPQAVIDLALAYQPPPIQE